LNLKTSIWNNQKKNSKASRFVKMKIYRVTKMLTVKSTFHLCSSNRNTWRISRRKLSMKKCAIALSQLVILLTQMMQMPDMESACLR
jgi:hypothetical protein